MAAELEKSRSDLEEARRLLRRALKRSGNAKGPAGGYPQPQIAIALTHVERALRILGMERPRRRRFGLLGLKTMPTVKKEAT